MLCTVHRGHDTEKTRIDTQRSWNTKLHLLSLMETRWSARKTRKFDPMLGNVAAPVDQLQSSYRRISNIVRQICFRVSEDSEVDEDRLSIQRVHPLKLVGSATWNSPFTCCKPSSNNSRALLKYSYLQLPAWPFACLVDLLDTDSSLLFQCEACCVTTPGNFVNGNFGTW